MTQYNTGNALGSSDPKDLYDNAQNFDNWANGPEDQYPDRFGTMRYSLTGFENRFDAVLQNVGYQIIGPYAAGLTITEYNQVFSRGGEYYRPGPGLTLPYTTTGNWGTEGSSFVSIGDNALRQDLANPASGYGADLVMYSSGVSLRQAIQNLNASSLTATQSGAGAVAETLLSSYRRFVYPEQFGASVGTGGNDSAAIQAALDRGAGGVVYLTPGKTYLLGSAVLIPSNTTLIAYGAHIKRYQDIDSMIRNKGDGVTGGYGQNSNIELLGGFWDANDAFNGITVIGFNHSDGIRIRDVKVDNPTKWHHIEINGCRNVLIDGCTFVNGANMAMATNEAIQIDMNIDMEEWPWNGPADSTRCQSINISNCYFQDVGTGIGTHSTTAGGSSHARIFIHNCVFSGVFYAGIHALKWSGIKITDNYFQGGYYGIFGEMNGTDIQTDWQISGNTFYQIGSSSYSGSDARAIHVNGATTAYVRGLRILHNTVLDHVATKATHAMGANYCRNVIVQGNQFYNINKAAWWSFGQTDAVIEGNHSESTNVTATSGISAIMVGSTGSVDTAAIIVRCNRVASISITQTDRGLVQGNIVNSGGITNTSNTNTTVSGNIVGNTYT